MERDRNKNFLFQCNDNILKWLLFILWFFAITVQAVVSVRGYVLVTLSADYLNEVFSAICTVAVLGNAILSLLFGVYDKKTLGIPFQDVLNHSLVGNVQRFTIEVMTISIVFALAYYVFQLYNLLFAVLVQNVCLLFFSCHDLWRFLSDKDTQKKTITEIVRKVSPSRYAVYVDNWFQELNCALVPNNKEETKEYCDLFNLVIESAPEKETQIRSCISRHLQMYFNSACEKLGFVEAFDLLREVIEYAHEDDQLDTQIALKYLEQLKTKDQVDIVNCEVTDLVKEIFDDSKFSDSDKMLFTYNYFCAVVDNVQMNFTRKNKQIDNILSFLCEMDEATYGEIKAKVIVNIVKHKILDNEDVECRRKLFCSLIESLKKRSYLSTDKIYIATISEIFRAFFFTIYLERDSLKEDYRKDLLTLFHSATNEKDRSPLSFMTLVFDRREEVVNWLAMDAVSFCEKPKIFWDYYSLAIKWKKVVWTMEEAIAFAFSAYHLIGSDIDGHPFVAILQSDEYSVNEKFSVCKTLLDLYDGNGFTSLMRQRIDQLTSFSGIDASNLSFYWKQEYSYYQGKIIELLSVINLTHFDDASMRNADIYKATQNLYSRDQLLVFDPGHTLFPGTRYTFGPHYVTKNKNFWESVPQRVSGKIREYINDYMESMLPSLSVNFKLDGVNALLEELKTADFQYRNYKYINDLAIEPALRNSSEFKMLSSMLEKIPYDTKSRLHGYYFLKQKQIPFNFQLQYHICNLSTRQCDEYVLDHKNSEGVYEIDGYHFDYEHAVKYAYENIAIEEITIFINVGLDSDCGFQIRFEH